MKRQSSGPAGFQRIVTVAVVVPLGCAFFGGVPTVRAAAVVGAHPTPTASRQTTEPGHPRPSSPGRPKLHKRYYRNHQKYVVIRWAAPRHPGSSRVTAYRVLVRDTHASPRVVPADCGNYGKSPGITRRRRCVDKGDSGDRIRFAVEARNHARWGPRSRWSKPITIVAEAT